MEQWMSVLALSHTESETMLKESEALAVAQNNRKSVQRGAQAVTEAAQQGLEERRL